MNPTPSPRIAYARHHDDEYFDHVAVEAPYARLTLTVVPRFKTSNLSGDEWRVSTKFLLTGDPQIHFERSFSRMRDAMAFGPHFVWTEGRNFVLRSLQVRNAEPGNVRLVRKGHLLWTASFPSFADAAIGLAWHQVIAGESSQLTMIPDDVERTLCCQAGCAAPPVCLYRLKKIQKGRCRSTFLDPDEFDARHRWFCARHAHRGDAGFEDADTNYEVIEGIDPRSAAIAEEDESPSAFGGVLRLDGSE